MSIHDYLAMFSTSFASVFLLGLQSKNVAHSRYLAAVVTSLGISISQFVFIKYSASGEYIALVVMAAGGCFGIASSIYVHDRFFKRKK